MNEVFDSLNKILYKKGEINQNAPSYLLQRYVSFYNPEFSVFLNDTVNKSLNLKDRDVPSKLMDSLFPKMPYKKIDYVKKPKQKETSLDIEEKELRIYKKLCTST